MNEIILHATLEDYDKQANWSAPCKIVINDWSIDITFDGTGEKLGVMLEFRNGWLRVKGWDMTTTDEGPDAEFALTSDLPALQMKVLDEREAGQMIRLEKQLNAIDKLLNLIKQSDVEDEADGN